jgi:phosphoribosylformylglycinamidine synthase
MRPDCLLFGESQSRVVVACAPNRVKDIIDLCGKNGIPAAEIGRVGGDRLIIKDLVEISLEKLTVAYFDALPGLMQELPQPTV